MYYKNIYDSFSFKNSYKKKLTEFLKNNTTIESGGNKLFNGQYNHLLQIPEELADLIFQLKRLNKKNKLNNYLEIGFSHGFTNTILNKFFKFKKNVAIDKFGPHINGTALLSNIRFKNLVLLCGDSKDKTIKDYLKNFGKFDLIFIDGDHTYNSVKNDFELTKSVSYRKTVIVFHDINYDNSGSKKFWQELKSKKQYLLKEIICKSYNFNYGTGILSFRN